MSFVTKGCPLWGRGTRTRDWWGERTDSHLTHLYRMTVLRTLPQLQKLDNQGGCPYIPLPPSQVPERPAS